MIKKVKIYLSGAITGRPQGNIVVFNLWDCFFVQNGFAVFNPHSIPFDQKRDWCTAMAACMPQLYTSDIIAFIPGWHDSKGAFQEFVIAHESGKEIVFLPAFRKGMLLSDVLLNTQEVI